MDQKSDQMGGVVLILAALTGIVGSVLHGPQPETLDAYAALGTGWAVSHVAIAMTGTLYVIASLFRARHFAGTASNGHALVATGLVIVGGGAVFAIGALETSGFSTVLAAGTGAAAQHAFLATSAVMISMAASAGYLFPVAIIAYGVAMMRDSGWPEWLAWFGVVLGVVSLVVNHFAIPLGPVPNLLGYVGDVWFGVLGTLFMGRGGSATSV